MWVRLKEMILEDFQREILNRYYYPLKYIGIEFGREDVQEALEMCYYGFESALQSCLSYWIWKQEQREIFEHPNAFLIKALNEQWEPYQWQYEWLDLPQFKSPGKRWWEAAIKQWGRDVCVQIIADFSDSHITFANGKKLPLNLIYEWGWQRTLAYSLEQLPDNHQLKSNHL